MFHMMRHRGAMFIVTSNNRHCAIKVAWGGMNTLARPRLTLKVPNNDETCVYKFQIKPRFKQCIETSYIVACADCT